MSECTVKEIKTLFVDLFVSKYFFDDSAHVVACKVEEEHFWRLEFKPKQVVCAF
jgi:hypothetical protein